MADARLDQFVLDALRSGASREDIERVLTAAGWSSDEVANALAAYAPMPFAVPVPRPRAYVSARDAALYLVMFGMLYFSAYHLGKLIFQFIHLAFPDPVADQFRRVDVELRWSLSAVLVTFPIYLLLAVRIGKEVAADRARRTSAVRKWLTYLTLALAACIVAGDLVYLLNGLLSGELTARFVLKSATVAAIAGAVFGYYLQSVREDERVLAK